MDREILLQHLVLAERHIAQGKAHLIRQETLVAELDRNGHDTKEAEAILATLRQTQALHLQDRDRILSELQK